MVEKNLFILIEHVQKMASRDEALLIPRLMTL